MLVPSALGCSVPRRTNGFLNFESVSRTFLLSDIGGVSIKPMVSAFEANEAIVFLSYFV